MRLSLSTSSSLPMVGGSSSAGDGACSRAYLGKPRVNLGTNLGSSAGRRARRRLEHRRTAAPAHRRRRWRWWLWRRRPAAAALAAAAVASVRPTPVPHPLLERRHQVVILEDGVVDAEVRLQLLEPLVLLVDPLILLLLLARRRVHAVPAHATDQRDACAGRERGGRGVGSHPAPRLSSIQALGGGGSPRRCAAGVGW